MKNLLIKYLPLRNAEGGGSGGGDNSAPDPASQAQAQTLLGSEGDPVETPDPAAAVVKAGDTSAGDTAEKVEYVEDPALTPEENAAKKAEHDAAQETGKSGDTVIDPQSYDLSAPEGFVVDPAVETEFRQFASDNKLSVETVDKLKGLQIKLIEKQTEQHAQMVTNWGNELKADKEIGGQNLPVATAHARAAMKEFFPPEARDILNKTGLGNHPAMVKGMARIGAAMGEGKSVSGGAVTSVNRLDIMYPDKE